MKEIVICYTLAGHTGKVADMIAAQRNCEQKKFKISVLGVFRQLLTCGRGAPVPDVSGYSAVWVGSPIWMGKFCPNARSMCRAMRLHGKTVHLFATYGSTVAGSFKDMAAIVKSKGGRIGRKVKFKSDASDAELVKVISSL